MTLRKLWLLLLGAFLLASLVWAWPLLWLWRSDRAMLESQEKDAAMLYAAAPRALLKPQKVSGPSEGLDGRYLSKSGVMANWMKQQGFLRKDQYGNVTLYHNGADLTAQTICVRFSRGFEVCNVRQTGTSQP